MKFLALLVMAASLLGGGASAVADDPAAPSEYITLKSDHQGINRDVRGSVYAYGYFGTKPKGPCSWVVNLATPTTHEGYHKDCWMWWNW